MSDISSISAVVAAIGVIVGVVFTVLQLRDLVKTRQTSLAIQLNPWLRISGMEVLETWTKTLNLEFEDYKDFVNKYGAPLSEAPIHGDLYDQQFL